MKILGDYPFEVFETTITGHYPTLKSLQLIFVDFYKIKTAISRVILLNTLKKIESGVPKEVLQKESGRRLCYCIYIAVVHTLSCFSDQWRL
jgi:hypothetical protein